MFKLSDEHVQLQQTFRDFAENEVKPLAKELDETERFPLETIAKMAEMGMMGLPVPEELGGSGIDQLGYILAVEELSKVCATTGIILSAHTSLCCWPIMTFGTPEQKEKYLKPLASGKKLGAFALTEPSAGTDASMQKSVAVLEGDHYVLNGNKVFITNAGRRGRVHRICHDQQGARHQGHHRLHSRARHAGLHYGQAREQDGSACFLHLRAGV